MQWMGNNATTHIISLFAVFAVLTGFSLTGTESLSLEISSPKALDGISGLVYHFPDQAGEPAVFKKIDDTGYSVFRLANHRFFYIFGNVDSGSASVFSRLLSHFAENSFDSKSTIQIKLRI